jgi:hypothetical protein
VVLAAAIGLVVGACGKKAERPATRPEALAACDRDPGGDEAGACPIDEPWGSIPVFCKSEYESLARLK